MKNNMFYLFKIKNTQKNTKKHPAIWMFLGVFLALILSRYVLQLYIVKGPSMEPSYFSNSPVLINKLKKDFSRYDIIVFKHNSRLIIKRIIALPTEEIKITPSGIYINGALLESDFQYSSNNYSSYAPLELTLGPDEFFVMGDNRPNSIDSRSPEIGTVQREDIIGCVQ